MIYLQETKDGVIVRVHVQPRASRNELAGTHGNALKVRLTSPPVDGEANEACQRFLAALLGVPRRNVELIGGAKSRDKQFAVGGMTIQVATQRIEKAME